MHSPLHNYTSYTDFHYLTFCATGWDLSPLLHALFDLDCLKARSYFAHR